MQANNKHLNEFECLTLLSRRHSQKSRGLATKTRKNCSVVTQPAKQDQIHSHRGKGSIGFHATFINLQEACAFPIDFMASPKIGIAGELVITTAGSLSNLVDAATEHHCRKAWQVLFTACLTITSNLSLQLITMAQNLLRCLEACGSAWLRAHLPS